MAKPLGYGGRDAPDYGVSNLYNTKAIINDLSELAVRLDGVSTFDRTGTVLYQETFRQGLANWEHNSFPAGAFAVPTARRHSIKDYSIKLNTTQDDSSYSGINRGYPLPYISRMGYEFHLFLGSTINRLMLSSNIYTGTYRYTIQLELNQEQNKITLINSEGIQEIIDTWKLNASNLGPWHVIKIVFDLITEFHYRLVIDENDYDVSNIGVRKVANVGNPIFDQLFMLYSFGSNVRTCYLDNIVITIDEPM